MALTPQDYRNALESQTACNGLALVNSLAEVMQRIEGGTDVRNRHPIVRLYLTQLQYLNGGDDTKDYFAAYTACFEGSKI